MINTLDPEVISWKKAHNITSLEWLYLLWYMHSLQWKNVVETGDNFHLNSWLKEEKQKNPTWIS